jgi:hypothetical protein
MKGYEPVIQWIANDVKGLSDFELKIGEICPNGGRWTYSILASIKKEGWPRVLNYDLLGSQIEADFILRDVMKPLFKNQRCTYGSMLRVRSYEETPKSFQSLISEVYFETVLVDLKTRVNLISKYHQMYCFDTIPILEKEEINRLITLVGSSLSSGGSFICLLHPDQFKYFTNRCSIYRMHAVSTHRYCSEMFVYFHKKGY